MFQKEKSAIASSLNLPKDVVLGEPLISLVGRHTVTVENYRGILLYTDTLVKLQAKTCKICIEGTRLKIEYYSDEDMKITGHIKAVTFES